MLETIKEIALSVETIVATVSATVIAVGGWFAKKKLQSKKNGKKSERK